MLVKKYVSGYDNNGEPILTDYTAYTEAQFKSLFDIRYTPAPEKLADTLVAKGLFQDNAAVTTPVAAPYFQVDAKDIAVIRDNMIDNVL
jgi:hypothetical protein